MSVELVVLGVVLIVMGAVQTWLRHGPAAKELRAEEDAVAMRRAEYEAARARLKSGRHDVDAGGDEDDATGADEDEDDTAGGKERDEACVPARRRSGKVWTAWTAVLGGVGIALGIALVVLGVTGH